MNPKNDTIPLALSFLVTVGLVGGLWWLAQRSGIVPGIEIPGTSSRATNGFAKIQNVPSGLFNYGGSTTWAPIRRDVDSVIQSAYPNFQLRYTDPITAAPGSGTGIRMLLANQLTFSQSSRSLNDKEYQQAQQRGFSLKEIPVAIDGIAIAVSPTLNTPGLTLAQLKDIYTSKLVNWSQVGGPNLIITPYSRRKQEGGTIEFFVENVLEEQEFGSTVEFVSTTTEALRKVAANPGAIYYASAPEVVDQCTIKPLPLGRKAKELIPPYQEPLVPTSACPNQRNQLNSTAFQSGQYPITRRLFVIVKQNGLIDQQAGEAYANLLLSEQGQELIAKAGFVRIR